jgi:hypothetical protein
MPGRRIVEMQNNNPRLPLKWPGPRLNRFGLNLDLVLMQRIVRRLEQRDGFDYEKARSGQAASGLRDYALILNNLS